MKNPEFIIHGNVSSEAVENIKKEGFKFKEGRETISNDFFMGMDFAQPRQDTLAGSRNENPVSVQNPGSLIVMKVPNGYKIDYGTETKISVDKKNSEISGHIGKYSGGRKQLGIYNQESSNILPENIITEIKATPKMVELTSKLKDEIISFNIKIPDAVQKIADEIERENKESITKLHNYENRHELEKILSNLLEGSLTNSIQNRIRRLSLEIRMLEGYKIKDEDKIPGIEFNKKTRELVEKELSKIKEIMDKGNFTTGLSSMDKYLKTYIPRLKEDLDRISKD